MNLIAYVSSLNDKTALLECLEAVRAQTHAPAEILVVDNRSSDGTQLERLPPGVTLICNLRNLGTSGAAAVAFRYALDAGYEWIWTLDQDSRPRTDALERLVALHDGFAPETRERIGILSSALLVGQERELLGAQFLSRERMRYVRIDPAAPYFECDTTIWSGSLYRLDAVRKVGFPRYGINGAWEDFALDMGDTEFGYRIKRAGYRVLVHPGSLIDHAIGNVTKKHVLGRTLVTSNHAPFRRYLSLRNMVYFWLFVHPDRRLLPVVGFLMGLLLKGILKTALIEPDPGPKIWASVRGAWDGLRGRLEGRWE